MAVQKNFSEKLMVMVRGVVKDGDSKVIKSACDFGINSSKPEEAVEKLEKATFNFISEKTSGN